jgi:hypothetical protein
MNAQYKNRITVINYLAGESLNVAGVVIYLKNEVICLNGEVILLACECLKVVFDCMIVIPSPELLLTVFWFVKIRYFALHAPHSSLPSSRSKSHHFPPDHLHGNNLLKGL